MKTIARCLMLLIAAFALPALAADVEFSRVEFRSRPSGGEVLMDGEKIGVTPFAMPSVSVGRHHFRWQLAGYGEIDRVSTVGNNALTRFEEEFTPLTALLLVSSEPDGCDIEIDGISRGVTPRLITTLEARSAHRMTLRKAGYLAGNYELRFNGRIPLYRHEKLIRDSGIVEIATEPAGVEVMVNGIARGRSPLTVSDVPKGRANVRLRLDGYEEEVRELSIAAGDNQKLTLTMKEKPGKLALSSVPEGVRMYVNDEFVGKTPCTVDALPKGVYKVRSELEGYGDITREVTIGRGQLVREEFRPQNILGRIELRTNPAGVQVWLDGRQVGVTATNGSHTQVNENGFSDVFAIEGVQEGEHTLLLRHDGYGDVVRHPKVINKKTVGANIRMKRSFKPNIRIETDAGVVKGMLVENTPDYIVIEVKLGVQRSFPRNEIKKLTLLDLEGEK